MAFTVNDLQDLLRILREHPEWRVELRPLVLSEELLSLPERFERLTEQVQALAEAQQRTEERLESLAEAQRRTEERLASLVEQVGRQADELRGLTVEVRELVGWQRGEDGRRRGEHYEQEIGRRAPYLFNGGKGGAPSEPWVRQELTALLGPLLAEEPPPQANPFLADLIWWKDETVAVVEASLRVNGQDVERAAKRAETIRSAGATVIGVVIGEDWVGPDAQPGAMDAKVEWKVGGGLSPGLLAFRQLTNN